MSYNLFKEVGPYRHRFVRAIIIMANGQIKRKTFGYDTKGVFTYKGKSYIVHPSGIFYEKNKPYSLYYEKYSAPLRIFPDELKMKLSSENLKDVLNTKVIKEITGNSNEKMILYLIIGINIILSIVIIAKIFGVIE